MSGLFYPAAVRGGYVRFPDAGETLYWCECSVERTSQRTHDFTFKCGDTVQPTLSVLTAGGLVAGSLKLWIQTDTQTGLDFLLFPAVYLFKFSRISLVWL